jgi:DNA-binding transcriptional regulator YiaG
MNMDIILHRVFGAPEEEKRSKMNCKELLEFEHQVEKARYHLSQTSVKNPFQARIQDRVASFDPKLANEMAARNEERQRSEDEEAHRKAEQVAASEFERPPLPPTKSFCQLFQQARSGKGLTQKQLANQMGVALGTIKAWESGKEAPKSGQRAKLNRILNTTLP